MPTWISSPASSDPGMEADVCRIAAYLGAESDGTSLVFHGDHSLYRQSWAPRELLSGSVNADGYGVVWYGTNGPARLSSTAPIWHDEDLRGALSGVSSGCIVAALRNATVGLSVDGSGVLPMVHGKWTFVLNGYVPDFRRSHMRALRADLPDDLYGELRGSSDTETLLLLAVAALREGATLGNALLRIAARVRERVGQTEAQLNLMLSDGDGMAAIRTATVERTNSLYLAERPAFAPRGVVIASEAFDDDAAWGAVEGHTLVEIGPNGLVETRPVPTPF